MHGTYLICSGWPGDDLWLSRPSLTQLRDPAAREVPMNTHRSPRYYKPCSGNIIDLKSVNYMSKNVTFQLFDI